MTTLPPAARRVADAARNLGLSIDILVMPSATHTAAEAAAACGCGLGEIVKSLIFRGTSDRPLLLLVAGTNRVDEAVAGAAIGEPLARADADFVRAATGYAIGGIPPFGPARPIATWLDRDLLAHDRVWAAAGTANTLFRIDPAELRDRLAAAVIAVK
jgi:prolyl-tRNA editing enzyme YbaK/EbsC (Cys-tRNA(Pro) deacylase)